MRPVAAAVVLLALMIVPAAGAKGGLVFDRHTARVGATITLSSTWIGDDAGVVVYFLPLADSARWWRTYQALSPEPGKPHPLASAIRLGRIERWGAHGGRLRFHVPRVVPGRYVLGFWCIPCDNHWTSALPNYRPSPFGILRVTR